MVLLNVTKKNINESGANIYKRMIVEWNIFSLMINWNNITLLGVVLNWQWGESFLWNESVQSFKNTRSTTTVSIYSNTCSTLVLNECCNIKQSWPQAILYSLPNNLLCLCCSMMFYFSNVLSWLYLKTLITDSRIIKL